MPRLGAAIVGLFVLAGLAFGLLLTRYLVVEIPRANVGSRTELHKTLVRAFWHYTLADRRSMVPLAAAISSFASE